MDENLPRWIWASITKHFDAFKQNIRFEVQGYSRIEQAKDSFLIRINGPIFNKLTINSFQVSVDINILVTSIKEDTDVHKIHKMCGIISAGFTDDISIYKYGNDNSLYGCFTLDSPIIITHFGPIEETTNVLQSTVEAEYTWRN